MTDLNGLTSKKILITGASGYLAHSVIHKVKGVACDVICVSRSQGDIRDPSFWLPLFQNDKTRPDVIFHFSAQTSAYFANENPVEDLKSNVLPITAIIEATQKAKHRPAIYFSSTVTIYGLTESIPVSESCPDRPTTVYDLHKLMAEQELRNAVSAGWVDGAILRLANLYGPGPKSSRSDRGILNQMVQKALRGEALTVYGTGDKTRDYVYVDDVAEAFLKAAVNKDQVNGEFFNIGSGKGHTISQAVHKVAELVAEKTGKRCSIVSQAPPPNLLTIESRNFVADTEKFTKATGWRASVSLDQGLRRTVEALC